MHRSTPRFGKCTGVPHTPFYDWANMVKKKMQESACNNHKPLGLCQPNLISTKHIWKRGIKMKGHIVSELELIHIAG